MNPFNRLPAEIILIISDYLSDMDLINITKVSQYINQIFDTDRYFWKQRFTRSTQDIQIINKAVLYDILSDNFNEVCHRLGAGNQIAIYPALRMAELPEVGIYQFYRGFLENTHDINKIRDFGIIAAKWHSNISPEGLNLLCTTTAPSERLICFLDELVACVGSNDLNGIFNTKIDNHHVRYIKRYFFDK